MAEVVYSLGVLEEQMRETCALSEVDILFSMFNDHYQGPATPPVRKGTPRSLRWQSPTSPLASPPASPAMHADLASIDALFSRCAVVCIVYASCSKCQLSVFCICTLLHLKVWHTIYWLCTNAGNFRGAASAQSCIICTPSPVGTDVVVQAYPRS